MREEAKRENSPKKRDPLRDIHFISPKMPLIKHSSWLDNTWESIALVDVHYNR